MRAACRFLGLTASGNRHQCFKRICKRLKERDLIDADAVRLRLQSDTERGPNMQVAPQRILRMQKGVNMIWLIGPLSLGAHSVCLSKVVKIDMSRWKAMPHHPAVWLASTLDIVQGVVMKTNWQCYLHMIDSQRWWLPFQLLLKEGSMSRIWQQSLEGS